jgi:tetratricopeptide (TPR) repeat protein
MQRRLPYLDSVDHGKTGFLFEDTGQLISILTTIAESPETRTEIPSAARRYVLEHRSQSKGSGQRLDFYRNMLSGSHRRRNRPETVSLLHAGWSNLKGAIRKGRHIELTSTRFERLVYDGLVALQNQEDNTIARELFDEAASLEPGNYLPPLFGSQAATDPVKYLTRAIDLRPDSLKAWILLGEEYSRLGKIKEALEAFGRSAELYPDYEVPYTRASAVLERIGESREARRLSQRANRLGFPQPLQ